MELIIGDMVRVGVFPPMSSMERYEGVIGIVIDIEVNECLGDVLKIQEVDTGHIFKTRRKFCVHG